MANPQNRYLTPTRDVSIQSQEACLAYRDHELPQTLFDESPDQRVVTENLDRIADRNNLCPCERRIIWCIEIEDALEVGKGLFGEDYLRQDLALGRFAGLPAARVSM